MGKYNKVNLIKYRFSSGAAGFFYDIVDPLLINAFVNDLKGDWKAFSKGADPKTGLIDD